MGQLERSLIEELSQHLNPKYTEIWNKLKHELRMYLPQTEIDELRSMHDIYARLESKGFIQNGKCHTLLHLFVHNYFAEYRLVATYLDKLKGNTFFVIYVCTCIWSFTY